MLSNSFEKIQTLWSIFFSVMVSCYHVRFRPHTFPFFPVAVEERFTCWACIIKSRAQSVTYCSLGLLINIHQKLQNFQQTTL